jgi:hypothetical protein
MHALLALPIAACSVVLPLAAQQVYVVDRPADPAFSSTSRQPWMPGQTMVT